MADIYREVGAHVDKNEKDYRGFLGMGNDCWGWVMMAGGG